MRSLFSFGASKETAPLSSGTGHRPEVLRRQTLATNARIIIALSGVLMPVSVYFAVIGSLLPLIIAGLALTTGMASLALHHNKMIEESATAQVLGTIVIGAALGIADPRFGDLGLAVVLMAPILAALLGRQQLRRLSWVLLGMVVASAVAFEIFGPPQMFVEAPVLATVSVLAFATAVGLVLYTAHRINRAYEVYDRAQMSAYQHLIEHVQDGVMRFSGAGEILMMSRSTEELLGCRRYEMASNSLHDSIYALDRAAFNRAFEEAAVDGRVEALEIRMRQHDPRSESNLPKFIWVEVSLSPVLDAETENGRNEVVALLRDVTSRKAEQAAMAEARRIAEEASSAKSRFLATIGHELRTPLNAVVGFSEMMTSGIGGDMSATHKEYAALIHQSGKHLLEVVRMLLDMSKLEAGKFELQAEPFVLESLIDPSFKIVEAMAIKHQVTLVADVAAGLPAIVGDERACRQIMLNLLSNAIKFSNPGGTVKVSIKRQGQALNLSIIDHGVGMAPQALDRIGEPFFQVQDGLARRYEGTGLGLSIVKGLVDLHKGTLRAMSEIGSGTTMTVLLPINGPATKTEDTVQASPARTESAEDTINPWQDEKRKAL
jgi:cell cycle sensor histidine kinase DivJ